METTELLKRLQEVLMELVFDNPKVATLKVKDLISEIETTRD